MTDRQPLQPVDGLGRTSRIMPPPRRIPTPEPTPGDSPAPGEYSPAPISRLPTSSDAEVMRSTTLSIPVRLVEQLRERATRDHVSQPEVLMDALSAKRDQLADLVAAANTHRNSEDELFVRNTPRTSTEPLTTLSLRMLSRNLDAIDQLVHASEASSRSQLCTIALRHYLAEADESSQSPTN